VLSPLPFSYSPGKITNGKTRSNERLYTAKRMKIVKGNNDTKKKIKDMVICYKEVLNPKFYHYCSFELSF